ncbi:MAG: UDP-N-acetylmuramoyl-L-alanine--D-glutamate ligase [Polynucleobacter sp. 24-46-87]|jgi:UDP-N-acetylmuramoylalanine--D-glutamate ligase|uniref:UDP-N-acetylmuramoyl-L-alanine--D-glutamate ligase n=1 Tax=unclassified Polynucleobacter TaxID=2640945 RepID=UPI000BC6B9B5|nr:MULTISPECIES: UDP-N-acetylmuramoyl-L-alanine--D-glutamate ligase [unclassified Polynucleobacter]OYY20632.1 MAG: UDP-N-acetylmuramoyl-L-alanine--D-glutamate ligase [Polynucleobacter sp. 35-46-11]OZA16309.1 MAG: UDP-N-acetylmuramoyl-L-alanine--D-glutamate ligase [Polynucleobacter sp. 24-46-87]OZA78475.1 MAG: UDP-N-acetylmuramoyl-L-alanine--D-glutamate ligase [Polynucleobacter sp. 39-46-10]
MHNLDQAFANPALIADEGYQAPQHFLILGLGESGYAMAKWCLRNAGKVSLADTRDREHLNERQKAWLADLEFAGLKDAYFGPLDDINLNNIDVIGISPGLSPLQEPVASFLVKVQETSIDIWGELEFFARAIAALDRMAQVVESQYKPALLAITGTNGKTTTTALTGQLCERAGKRVAVAGNISPAALDKLMSCLDESDQVVDMPEIWVLELSSFQLVYTSTFNATAATVLNITQDHLDWHGGMQAYVDAKANIFGQDTICILNRDDSLVMNLLTDEQKANKSVITFGASRPDEQGAFGIEHDLRAGGIDWLVWAEVDEDLEPQPKRRRKAVAVEEDPLRLKRLIPVDALRIRGRHNALNALAALALARSAGLPMNMLLHGLRDYHGEPHRVQSVAIVSNVEYVDDSKGTNVGATVAALNGLCANESGKRIWLIAGGEGKGQDFSPLRGPALRFVKGIYLIGKDAPMIAEALADSVSCVMSETLQNAVAEAAKQAQSGDIVLLSPACASFDQFSDYVARAEAFVAEVQELGMQFEGVHA